ncbi:hypothetical protein LguiB_005666 [Lonicera macranthoides]
MKIRFYSDSRPRPGWAMNTGPSKRMALVRAFEKDGVGCWLQVSRDLRKEWRWLPNLPVPDVGISSKFLGTFEKDGVDSRIYQFPMWELGYPCDPISNEDTNQVPELFKAWILIGGVKEYAQGWNIKLEASLYFIAYIVFDHSVLRCIYRVIGLGKKLGFRFRDLGKKKKKKLEENGAPVFLDRREGKDRFSEREREKGTKKDREIRDDVQLEGMSLRSCNLGLGIIHATSLLNLRTSDPKAEDLLNKSEDGISGRWHKKVEEKNADELDHDEVHAESSASAKEVAKSIKCEYGILVPYWNHGTQKKWHGMRSTETTTKSYKDLARYVKSHEQTNLGSRCFVKIKTEMYSSYAGIYPLCYAVVDFENFDNWSWFMGMIALVVYGVDLALAATYPGPCRGTLLSEWHTLWSVGGSRDAAYPTPSRLSMGGPSLGGLDLDRSALLSKL